MRRLALVAALALGLVACGGASSTTVALGVVLGQPIGGTFSLQVTGSADAANAVARMLEQTSRGGLVAAQLGDAASQPQQDCSRSIPIATYPVTQPSLQGLDGQKVTLAIYGTSQLATASCQQLSTEFSEGIPLLGGNRQVYRMPSSGMEPTLHCARPGQGCGGHAPDVLVTQLTDATGLERGAIIVFSTPRSAAMACGEGGVFVKRVIGLPGETVREDGHGFMWTRSPGSATWTKLLEAYIPASSRAEDSAHFGKQWSVPAGAYFVVGDNRSASCDSRQWGSVPGANIIGPVVDIIRGGKALKPAGIPG